MLLEIFHGIADVMAGIVSFINPENILMTGGIFLLVGIIFAENGLFFGFLLPGDSLLFTAGLMTATGVIENHITIVLATVTLAAIAGDFVGYWFGLKTGDSLMKRPDSMFFKKKHLQSAHTFYTQYGAHAVIIGRFVPIIRTFAPILAGSVRMPFRKFVVYNIVGAFVWTHSMILAGFFLVKLFPQIQHFFEYVIIGVGLIATIPLIRTYIRKKRQKAAMTPAATIVEKTKKPIPSNITHKNIKSKRLSAVYQTVE